MAQRTLARVIAGTIVVVAALVVLTAEPLWHTTKAQRDLSATAVGQVRLAGADNVADCVDVTFAAQATYSVAVPVVDVWGISRVDDLEVGPAKLAAKVRPQCEDQVELSEVTGYLNAPVCVSGPCEGAKLIYMAGQGATGNQVEAAFPASEAVPGSGFVPGNWCLGFAADFAFAGSDGGAASDGATITSSDLCLDVS